MAKTKQEASKTKEEIFEEIKILSQKAKETASHQLNLLDLNLGDEDIDTKFDSSILKDTANPEESHRLYYGIQRLLTDNLPKGKKNKKLRQYVYDEKNLFLNRGIDITDNGTRGSDGRMTYINPFLNEAFNVVAKWVSTGANAYDIYMEFWNLNENRGYHKESNKTKDIEPSTEFDQNLKTALNYNPKK